MNTRVSNAVIAVVILVVLAVLGWVGWRYAGPSTVAVQADEEKSFRAAEANAKKNGIDLRTVPQWAGLYYKYHPEEKPPSAAAGPSGAPTTALPPGSPPPSAADTAGPPAMH